MKINKKAKSMAELNNSLEIHEQKNELILNPDIYPLDVIYRASFSFLDKVFIFLDMEKNKKLRVELTPKISMSHEDWLSMAGEFKNELLTSSLRSSISKTTSRVRDLIVEKAIIGALPVNSTKTKPADSHKDLSADEDNLDFLDDPLGIAIPWEEKYGKKN